MVGHGRIRRLPNDDTANLIVVTAAPERRNCFLTLTLPESVELSYLCAPRVAA
jgi:hypothetical protein